MRIRFGDFRIDTDRLELTRSGQPVHLPPKAFRLLQILIEARPKAVSQQVLYDQLWPGTFVQLTSLHNVLHQVRTALGDEGRDAVRTVYGFGFSFAGDAVVEDEAPRTRWQIVVESGALDLHEGENIVGRNPDSQIRLDFSSVSRRHACIRVDGGSITIEDLQSKNGTKVQGRVLRARTVLNDGDELQFGTVRARLLELPPPFATETATNL